MHICILTVLGLAVCLKDSGIGVGLPDTGRVILEVRDGKVRIPLLVLACSVKLYHYGYSSTLLKQLV